jgi:NADPH-dependent 2,4-dienoyl-CoA reductase/sulfur reductase-like enzyme/TusA-related sulfurtransferase/rhodanese-related sulfurtransferase
MSMKLLVVGGVAGGASTVTRARRLSEEADIILFERGEFVSFANCGLPYYIGDEIKDRDDLLVTTVELMQDRFNIDVRTFNEVVDIDREKKEVTVRDLRKNETYTESYDKLVLCPGGQPIKPPLEGIDLDTVFTLWTIPDSDTIKAYIEDKKPESAVVIGGGFIGLEMAENLIALGVEVTIVEMLDQVMPPVDFEMASIVHSHIVDHGCHLHLSDAVKGFSKKDGKTVVTTQGGAEIECDMVILSIGVRPNNELANKAGLDMGERGGIKTNTHMQTSDPHIYAAGDVVEVTDFVSGTPAMIPLAGPANKQGRIVADNIFGRDSEFKGTQGSAVVKVFDMTVALTGNNEKGLQRNNIPYMISYTESGSHAAYYPGAQMMNFKLIFAPDDGKILGAQIVGMEGADKRIDVIATAIRAGMTVFDLEELELAYAPPYSSAKDPVNMAGFVASNILRKDVENVYWNEVDTIDKDSEVLLDVRDEEEVEMHASFEGSVHIPLNQLRKRLGELDKSKTYVVYCAMGLRGYIAYRMLVQNGFQCKNISGGYKIYMAPKADLTVKISVGPEQAVEFADDCFDNFDFEVNACGVPCPGPIMKLAKKIKEMEDGQIVKITASDVGFSKDVPGWCQKTGNELIALTEDKGTYTALISKGAAKVAVKPEIEEPCKEEVATTSDVDVDFEVNACGVPCPGPIMKLAKKIKEMETGQVVKITASDVGFSKDVPGWCTKTGHELISLSSEKGIYTALIRKG